MNTNFRNMAREALKRAKLEIASGERDRLPYAALEIRNAMEAVTYDRAESYKNEIPDASYRTWQPRKLLEYLLEIEPTAVLGSSLTVGVEEEYGKPAKVMQPLGSEEALTMRDLKNHYNALGSYLHIPTLYQLEKGNVTDLCSLEIRCQTCIDILEKVLKSPVWNINIGMFSRTECVRCKFLMKKRLQPELAGPVGARCIGCGAEYIVTDEGPDAVVWTPKWQDIDCRTSECDKKIGLWPDEIRPGTNWKCEGCGEAFVITLAALKQESSTSD